MDRTTNNAANDAANDADEQWPLILPTAEQEASERRIAERLTALETEKVLRRAMQLEHVSPDPTETFSPADLERIAAEVGINPQFVQQAIAEVRSEGEPVSKLEAWLVPTDPVAQQTVSGLTREQLDRHIHRWMTEYEGLRPHARVHNGVEWEVDRALAAKMRSAMVGGGNRLSRTTTGRVQHRVASISEDEHVVTLSGDRQAPITVAKVGVGGSAALGTVIALFGSGDIAEALAQGVPIPALLAIGSVLGARTWAKTMKRAVRGSLTGMAEAKKPPEPRFRWPWQKNNKRRGSEARVQD